MRYSLLIIMSIDKCYLIILLDTAGEYFFFTDFDSLMDVLEVDLKDALTQVAQFSLTFHFRPTFLSCISIFLIYSVYYLS